MEILKTMRFLRASVKLSEVLSSNRSMYTAFSAKHVVIRFRKKISPSLESLGASSHVMVRSDKQSYSWVLIATSEVWDSTF